MHHANWQTFIAHPLAEQCGYRSKKQLKDELMNCSCELGWLYK